MLTVNTNISSLMAQNNLNKSNSSLATSLQRLSSGLRVNSAKDDAAGLAIATGMTSQINGANQAVRNANDGISLAQTAEGTISQLTSNMQRIRELAVQSANGTLGTSDRADIQSEVDQLTAENARVIAGANFNGIALFDTGAGTTGITFQVGAGASAAVDQITVSTVNLTNASFAGGAGTINLSSQTFAQQFLGSADTYIQSLSTARANLGAVQNRFAAVVTNLQTYSTNMSASQSGIMDTDFASESANLTRNQIIQQASTAMLSQANQLPQAALSLLK
ncbi:flagellin [Crenobacter sp. SG2305]|uniref:flagellin N-terminal helical domain-containing protein n=1 Tax=Crenobacter oryzisoli TaxID=3056844 RepID=UPI0025AAC491|nr:flagellin [Crenobacter sp. SG2305]MDN0082648.1 flagellin [Crenobacter sp. SG2305]